MYVENVPTLENNKVKWALLLIGITLAVTAYQFSDILEELRLDSFFILPGIMALVTVSVLIFYYSKKRSPKVPTSTKNSKKYNLSVGLNIKFTILFSILLIGIILVGLTFSAVISDQIRNHSLDRVKSFYGQWVLSEATTNLFSENFENGDYENKEIVFNQFFEKMHMPEVIRIKVWSNDGTILFSNSKDIIGKNFGDSENFKKSIKGEIMVSIKDPVEPENIAEVGYGQLMEVYVPITFDSENYAGVIEVYAILDSLNSAVNETNNIILNVITIAIGFIIGILVILFVFVRKSILNPITQIKNASIQVSQGNLDAKVALETNRTDEISHLVSSFNEMTKSLKKNIELEKSLIQSRERLKNEKLTAIGSLSARIAHDLRNPLHVIKNAVEILKITGQDDENSPTGKKIKSIERAVQRMNHQLEGVLDFVRTKPLEVGRYSLLGIFSNAIDFSKIPSSIKIIKPEKDLRVDCDSKKMEIVLQNLIVNAAQSMKNQGTITLSFSEEEDKVMINVSDSGQGIPEDSINNIFEPLYTTKQEGTGLGLASCKNIIKEHGGSIKVKNNPTTFTIFLPKKPQESKS